MPPDDRSCRNRWGVESGVTGVAEPEECTEGEVRAEPIEGGGGE